MPSATGCPSATPTPLSHDFVDASRNLLDGSGLIDNEHSYRRWPFLRFREVDPGQPLSSATTNQRPCEPLTGGGRGSSFDPSVEASSIGSLTALSATEQEGGARVVTAAQIRPKQRRDRCQRWRLLLWAKQAPG